MKNLEISSNTKADRQIHVIGTGQIWEDQYACLNITGTINNSNQLVANDGQTLDIADNKEGKKLLFHTGQKVLVAGTVIERESKKQIIVSSYELITGNVTH